jgi:hypothetical protein
MDFCLECQNFVDGKEFVKHLKTEHKFRTKKQYIEKWNKEAEKTKEIERVVVEDEEVETTCPSLTPEEFDKYFNLSNMVDSLRMELGRIYQILNGVALRTSKIEEKFINYKRTIAAEKGLENLGWTVNPKTGEVIIKEQ